MSADGWYECPRCLERSDEPPYVVSIHVKPLEPPNRHSHLCGACYRVVFGVEPPYQFHRDGARECVARRGGHWMDVPPMPPEP